MNNQLDQFFLGDADMQRTVIMRMITGRPRQRDSGRNRDQLAFAQTQLAACPHVAKQMTDRHFIEIGRIALMRIEQTLTTHFF